MTTSSLCSYETLKLVEVQMQKNQRRLVEDLKLANIQWYEM